MASTQQAAVGVVPASVVVGVMQTFETEYNEDNIAASANLYSKDCFVTVNGGVENGGPFTGKCPQEVHAFLDQLRNKMGATNMSFTVTKVYGDVHEDLWTSDCGTGACLARWAQIQDGENGTAEWKIVSDQITFWPNNEDGSRHAEYLKRVEEYNSRSRDNVPIAVVCDVMQNQFEAPYNKDDTETAANCYAADCYVTVNGGVENDGPFTGKTPKEVHGFLNHLRNGMGAKNMKFTITRVEGKVHKDTWTCDVGTGACTATWEKQADGHWKIVKDEITFVPSN